jgi:hypothetical protein
MEYPPLRALFLITTKGDSFPLPFSLPPGIPDLQNPEFWSDDFLDFTYKCLNIDTSARPTAREITQHRFLKKSCSTKEWAKVVDAAKKMKARSKAKKGKTASESSSFSDDFW